MSQNQIPNNASQEQQPKEEELKSSQVNEPGELIPQAENQSQVVSARQQLYENRKTYQKLENLQGLEISSEIKCDLADHNQEKILFICTNPQCMAPRRLACGYCNTLHADHMKSLIKINQFRDNVNKARGSMNDTLSSFTDPFKRQLLDQNLFDLLKQRQRDLILQFETFLQVQNDQLQKLIDANTESYLFEEAQVLDQIGGFYDVIERIFGKTWPEIKSVDIQNLIKLDANYEDYNGQIQKQDIKRLQLSKEIAGVISDYFSQTEILMSDLEQEATNTIKKLLDKTFNQTFQDLEKTQFNPPSQNTTTRDVMTAKTSKSELQSQVSQMQEFHSTLFKEQHAPKSGWFLLDKVPLKYLEMPYIKKFEQKYGKFQYKDVLPQGLEFVTLGPVVNAKGDVFVGQWRNGQRWGRGEFFWKDGNYYIGTWEKGQPSGFGRMIYRNGNMYEGEFKEEKRHGKGSHFHLCGARYTGEWKDDLPHGNGWEILMNGDVFEGVFIKGLKDGKGQLRGVDGSLITGWWKENRINGKGEWLAADKRKYVGDFKDDVKHGEGVLTWPDGRKYEGPFKNGRMHGIGVWYELDTSIRKGEWQNGKRIQWIEELKKGDTYKYKQMEKSFKK